jgi:hypothetical protein
MEWHIYREVLTFVDWVHGSELHGNQRTDSWEVHKNFADESAD